METEVSRKEFLEEKFKELMHNHPLGNYITLENGDCVEWFSDNEAEKFTAFTEYGTYTHNYDWDFSYDENLNTFVEGVLEFVYNAE